MGLAFLALVVGVVLVLRPLLKGAHYYSRVPIQLSLVAMFLVVPLVAAKFWPEEWLRHLAYFPIISLCLICEAFTKTLDEKGLAEAAWPTTNTILIGMLIGLVARIPGALHVLLRFPELLVAQTGFVLLIGEYLHFELLKGKNPFVRKKESVEKYEPEGSAQESMLLMESQQVGDLSL
jgi:7 transmembrane helices usually fused to an inactive transglutaminase